MKKEVLIKDFFGDIQKLKKGMQTKDVSELPDINLSDLKNIASFLAYDLSVSALRDKSKKMVWHVAMPKSGSTWLTNVIGSHLQGKGWRVAWPGLPGDRVQEISMGELYRQNLLDEDVFFHHMHSLGSDYNIDFCRDFNVKVLLQIRNIPDALVSLIDHFDNEDVMMPPAVYMNKSIWNGYDQQEKFNFVLNFAAPWFIRFWASWYEVLSKNPMIDRKVIVYDVLLSDKDNVFNEVVEFCDGGRAVAGGFNENVFTRLNKGKAGRGRSLPSFFMERLKELASLYPHVDFSPVGL